MKKGDKYIIEIAEVHTHYDDNGKAFPIARIKGFSSLVFDQIGLDRLVKVEETEEEKPQYLNCRFVVLGKERKDINIQVGGIYNIVDGKVEIAKEVYPLLAHFKNFDEVVAYFSGCFSKDAPESRLGHYSYGTVKVARIEEDE